MAKRNSNDNTRGSAPIYHYYCPASLSSHQASVTFNSSLPLCFFLSLLFFSSSSSSFSSFPPPSLRRTLPATVQIRRHRHFLSPPRCLLLRGGGGGGECRSVQRVPQPTQSWRSEVDLRRTVPHQRPGHFLLRPTRFTPVPCQMLLWLHSNRPVGPLTINAASTSTASTKHQTTTTTTTTTTTRAALKTSKTNPTRQPNQADDRLVSSADSTTQLMTR